MRKYFLIFLLFNIIGLLCSPIFAQYSGGNYDGYSKNAWSGGYFGNPYPKITLDRSSLFFNAAQNGTKPSDQTFTISNGGGGTLDWSVSDNASWLDLNPTSGTNSDTLTANINTTDLTPGTYNAIITISAIAEPDSAHTIFVTYTVDKKPSISLNKTSISFLALQNFSIPSPQTINVSNGREGTLNWTVSDNATWLDVTPTSGTNSGTLSVSINTVNMELGIYTAIITITADGAMNTPQTVQVNYSITDGKLLSPEINTPYLSSSIPITGANITTTTPTITWNSISGATRYALLLYRYSTNGESIKIFEDTIISSSLTTYKIPDEILEKGRWYKIQMKTLSIYNIWGDYTNKPYYFNILSDAPSKIYPQILSKVNTITPEFKWNKVQYATGYRLYITDENNDKKYDSYSAGSKISDTTFTLPEGILQYAKTYYWDMATINEASEPGETSATKYNFATVSSKISIIDKIVYTDLDERKTKDTVITIKNIGNDTLKISNIIIEGTHLEDFSLPNLTLPIQILPNQQKTITVRFNPVNIGVHFGRILIFSNDKLKPEYAISIRGNGKIGIPDPPWIDVKLNGLYNYDQILRWNRVYGATYYQIQISLDTNFSLMMKDSTGIIDTTYSIKGLKFNAVYYWRIRSGNSVGLSEWSNILSFTILPLALDKPVLSIPLDKSQNQMTSLVIIWNTVPNATSYTMQISKDIGFQNIIQETKGLTDTFKLISSLEYNTTYYWRINSKNIIKESEWSNIWSFTTLNRAPQSFTLLSPTNNQTIDLTYPTKSTKFSWNKSTDPDVNDKITYNLVFLIPGFNISKTNFSETEIAIDIMSFLKASTSYKWYVTATDGKTIISSDTFTFRTSANITKSESTESPLLYRLKQNYPNPFNPETRIEYSIPENIFVQIKIFDAYGREVETLISKTQTAGNYSITWQPKSLPSGVYYYKIQSGKYADMKKMLYLR